MLLKHEEKLTSIMNDIRDIKESGKTDNKVTRDKFNVLSQMLQEIEHKMDDMEERRNNARRETLKQQLFNLYYKYKERAEATEKWFCHNVNTSSFGRHSMNMNRNR